jgi:hypothetical protein
LGLGGFRAPYKIRAGGKVNAQQRLAACALTIVWLAVPALRVSGQGRKARVRDEREKSSAFSQRPFSADITITGKQDVYHGKIYAQAGAMRTDVRLSNGTDASVIERFDKGVEWILTPGRRYVVAPIDNRDDLLSALRNPAARVKKQDLGPETIGTYPCEEYRVAVSVKRARLSGWIWVARSPAMDGFIVQAKDQGSGESIELSNIRLESPDPSLFILPAGYQQIIKPSKPPKSAH